MLPVCLSEKKNLSVCLCDVRTKQPPSQSEKITDYSNIQTFYIQKKGKKRTFFWISSTHWSNIPTTDTLYRVKCAHFFYTLFHKHTCGLIERVPLLNSTVCWYTTEEKIRIFFALFFEGKMINICEKDYIRIKMGLERWRYSPWAIFSSNKTFFILHDDVPTHIGTLSVQLLRKHSDMETEI